jgi:hypothetical protein
MSRYLRIGSWPGDTRVSAVFYLLGFQFRDGSMCETPSSGALSPDGYACFTGSSGFFSIKIMLHRFAGPNS